MIKLGRKSYVPADIADCKAIVVHCGIHVGVFRKQYSDGKWVRDSLPLHRIEEGGMVAMLNDTSVTQLQFSAYPDDFQGVDTYGRNI